MEEYVDYLKGEKVEDAGFWKICTYPVSVYK
jgi:hypothetical protein